MTLEITLNNKSYIFLSGYQKEDVYRQALNALVNSVFGISFEPWYRAGYMNDTHYLMVAKQLLTFLSI